MKSFVARMFTWYQVNTDQYSLLALLNLLVELEAASELGQPECDDGECCR
jgi:hypothetical protein